MMWFVKYKKGIYMSYLLKQEYKNLINNQILSSEEFSNLEKIIFIHNYILSTVKYPNVKLFELLGIKFPIINFLNSEEKNYSSLYGVLVNRKAFCIGIAKTLKQIFDDLQIKNKIVKGYINSPQKGKVIHMWNIVFLNGVSYHLDTTFDITRNPNCIKKFRNKDEKIELPSARSTEICINHLLVNDTKIEYSHLWNRKFYPSCQHCYPENEIIMGIENLKSQGIKFKYI